MPPPAATSVTDAASTQTGPGTFSNPGTGERAQPVPVTIEPALPPVATPDGPSSLEAALRGAAQVQASTGRPRPTAPRR